MSMTIVGRFQRAVWRNDFVELHDLVKSLQNIDTVDEESGWSALHRALYFGHVRCATYLLRKGAKLELQDYEGKTPLDLITKESIPCSKGDTKTDVYSWGSGANYQLGTGLTGIHQFPKRLDSLRNHSVVALAASKFHNLALTSSGEVYCWGWGRGGRLGLPEAQFHNNDGAQMFPRLIPNFTKKRVVSVAVAKHHSLAVTDTGEVYSWGLNRDGRLGYMTVNKQATPKRIQSLKGVHGVSASAANKHSAIVTSSGEVYTWGSNVYGQLGYGSSDSISNPTPRKVDALQHKAISLISLSKRHTLALSTQGEVYSWGNKRVAPKKVSWNGIRDQETVNLHGTQIQFHRGFMKVKKPLAVGIAAGVYQSACITTTGCVFCWYSNNPEGKLTEVAGSLSGKKAISISAGKYSLAVSVSSGEVFSWECKPSAFENKDSSPKVSPIEVKGVKNITSVAVGEKHFLVLQDWKTGEEPKTTSKTGSSESVTCSHSSSDSLHLTSSQSDQGSLQVNHSAFACLAKTKDHRGHKTPPKLRSLQQICEKVAAEHVLNPTNALSMLEYADISGAELLKMWSLRLIILNLALVLYESHEVLFHLPEHLVLEIEEAYQKEILKLPEGNEEEWWLKGWTPNQGTDITSRRPTYTVQSSTSPAPLAFLGSLSDAEIPIARVKENRFLSEREPISKTRQTVIKKLEQIEALFDKEASGLILDHWQRLKIAKQPIFKRALEAIDSGECYDAIQGILNEASQLEHQPREEEKVTPKEQKKKKKSKVNTQMKSSWEDIKHKENKSVQLPRFLEPPREEETWIPVHSHKEKKAAAKLVPKSFSMPTTQSMQCVEEPNVARRQLLLGDFMPPQNKLKNSLTQIKQKDNGPVWGGASLRNSSRSFQSIQEEQRNNRPGCPPLGEFTKPAVERVKTVSKWQIPCDIQIQSIHSIQIEEKAVQELSQLYKGAKVKVKIGTARKTTETVKSRNLNVKK